MLSLLLWLLKRWWYFLVNRKRFSSPYRHVECSSYPGALFAVLHMWFLNTQIHKALQNPSIGALLVVLLANPTWHSLLSKTSCLKKHHNHFCGAAAHAGLEISEQRQSWPLPGSAPWCYVLHGKGRQVALSCFAGTAYQLELFCKLYIWVGVRKVIVYPAESSVTTLLSLADRLHIWGCCQKL